MWVGLGNAGQGDFEAEGFDLADVVGDLAPEGGLPLVVVRAEILVAHIGLATSSWKTLDWMLPTGTWNLPLPQLRAGLR